MQRRICHVLTSLKERTCVSYAKIATIGGFCDINHIIIKATSHDDLPLPNKYIHELLKIFSFSPSSYRAFALSFTRRFTKTRSWRVAIKCLLLLHRLLRSLPNNSPFRAELLWTRTNGLLSLHPCNFRHSSSPASKDHTIFIKSYARLLDECLDCVSMEQTDTCELISHEYEENSPLQMKELGRMIETLPQLQSLLDRVIECWPTGAASRNFLVQSAMKHVIRDSFSCYATFRREVAVVLDNLIQLPYRNCVTAFAIYKKASLQTDKLSQYHEWCKNMGYCGSYEYPFIDKIPHIQIQALETFLNGMWQFSDQSSSSNETSNVQSPLSFTDDDAKIDRTFDQEVKEEMEIETLIKWEEESNSVGWEDVLEACISVNSSNGWGIEVYNPPYVIQASNPFYQHRITNFYYGSCPNTPIH